MTVAVIADALARLGASTLDGSGVIPRALCLGPPEAKHLSGGACTAMAAAAALGKEASGPIVCIATTFLAAPASGAQFDVRIDARPGGKRIHRWGVDVRSEERESFRAEVVTGRSRDVGAHAFTTPPNAPPPEACAPIPWVRATPGDLQLHLDMRLIRDGSTERDGVMRFWTRAPGAGLDAAFLAVVADFVPEAIHSNIGQRAGATSLDNVLRIHHVEPSDWLLCETHLDSVADGLFHGRMSIFAASGALLATGSQSGVVRLLEPRD